ncbi:MAG: hypothetical protein MPK10_09525 [Gammaproteobacteria bacterium]|nr:hypothetical protein [Gammaproteobacteria bacterium]
MKTRTRTDINEYLHGEEFARIYQAISPISRVAREAPLPKRADSLRVQVGELTEFLRGELGVEHGVMMLSGYTIGKQRWEHPEVAPADYVMVQRILDGGLIYRQKDETRRIGFAFGADGKCWTAAWKRTRDGSGVYLLNLRLGGERALRNARRDEYGGGSVFAGQ